MSNSKHTHEREREREWCGGVTSSQDLGGEINPSKKSVFLANFCPPRGRTNGAGGFQKQYNWRGSLLCPDRLACVTQAGGRGIGGRGGRPLTDTLGGAEVSRNPGRWEHSCGPGSELVSLLPHIIQKWLAALNRQFACWVESCLNTSSVHVQQLMGSSSLLCCWFWRVMGDLSPSWSLPRSCASPPPHLCPSSPAYLSWCAAAALCLTSPLLTDPFINRDCGGTPRSTCGLSEEPPLDARCPAHQLHESMWHVVLGCSPPLPGLFCWVLLHS